MHAVRGREPRARRGPRARPGRPERRRQVDADEHHRRGRSRPTPARCVSTARPTRPRRRATPSAAASPSSTRSSISSPTCRSPRTSSSTGFPAAARAGLDRSTAALRAADRGAARRGRASTSPPETLVERLSPGERQLVEVAKALQLDARHHHLRRADDVADARARPTRLFALIGRLRESGKTIDLHLPHPRRRARARRRHRRAARRRAGRGRPARRSSTSSA